MHPLPEPHFVRNEETKVKRVGQSVAVYIPSQKAIHVLNQTAQLLFELLAEPMTKRQLTAALALATNSNAPAIASDVAEVLSEFIEKRIAQQTSQ